ncbi:SGNH/GDSL hydrolase family protein [Frankia sp. AgPm24]|uniref:SGNH/GDSL hydrolase family protein n=1 Tax=Frankia sp. AgPm24 TaxID=631128 RepID=UPI00200E20F1|nr:SGNH/GDSL hydrolase family protein [Frankia sp. AgPm24]MCK9924628.1 SGNH/GDSL hydrolase family protein [Frankia sp. AgPm24]
MDVRVAAARFVALGDSITVGLGDGVTMGREHRGTAPPRGFAARFVDLLGPPGTIDYANLATTGATARDVRLRQLPAALECAPQLATVVAGMNDVLKPSFDALRLRQDLVWTVSRLRAEGATVLTATMPDPGRLLRLPAPLARLLTERVGRLNAAVWATARHDPGVLVVDLGHHPAVRRRSTFDVDRVHPGPHGHQLIAEAFTHRLSQATASPAAGPFTVGRPPAGVPRIEGHGETGRSARAHGAGSPLGVGLAGAPEAAPAAPGTLRHGLWLVQVGMPWLLGRCLAGGRRPSDDAPHAAGAPGHPSVKPAGNGLIGPWEALRHENLALSHPRRA